MGSEDGDESSRDFWSLPDGRGQQGHYQAAKIAPENNIISSCLSGVQEVRANHVWGAPCLLRLANWIWQGCLVLLVMIKVADLSGPYCCSLSVVFISCALPVAPPSTLASSLHY